MFDLDREAALDATGDDAGDDFGLGKCLFEASPGASALGFLARQPGFTRAVFHRVERDLDHITRLDLDCAVLVLELFDRDDRLGLQADIDDDHV